MFLTTFPLPLAPVYKITLAFGKGAINGYADIHTTLNRVAHGANHCVADQVGFENVISEIDRKLRVLDHPQLDRKRVDCRVVRGAQELGSG